MNGKRNIIPWIAILLLLSIESIYGRNDTIYHFSLAEAQAYALENNTKIVNAKYDVEIADARVWETTAMGLPQVSGSVDYQHIPGEIPTVDFAGGINEVFAAIFEALQREGIQVDVPMGFEGQESEPVKLAVKNSTTYSATLSQLIFSGEYFVGLQASRTYKQLSKNSLENTELAIKENISMSYFTILSLEKNKIILDSSLMNLKSSIRDTRAMYETGMVEETDIDQLVLNAGNVENSLKSVERTIEISYKLFKIQMGLPLETKVQLTENIDNILFNLKIESPDVSGFNAEENISYKIAETQEKLDELNMKREKAMYLPSLNAFYSYQDKTNAPDFDFTINHIIGFNISVPIFSSGMRNAKVKQARLEMIKSRNDKQLLEENLNMQVQQARYDYESAHEKYQIQRKNMELSKKIHEKTRVKFEQGVASSLDLTQAHGQYLDSTSKYTSAVIDLLNARINLDKILNRL
ncbi:MAG: TolC family protein [Bacteroidota bacterium]